MAALIPALVKLLLSGRGRGGGSSRPSGPKKDSNEAYWEKAFLQQNALDNSTTEAMKVLGSFNNSGGYQAGKDNRGEGYQSGTSRFTKR